MTQGRKEKEKKGGDVARLELESQNPHLPAAMRSASSPVKVHLTRAKRGLSRN
jgi:hypothetical protein